MAGARKNRLARETSPYLLQHADNPVDWYPWGPEALEKAKREDKPILLSIGYSACHWCHVMERESFENEAIARLMNEHFVPVKVDREERPDLDEIYMTAVQVMTGTGGWPLTVFLTPELEPFFGGTYFPPEDRWGRPGFATVLREIARVYREERDRVATTAAALTERLRALAEPPPAAEAPTARLVDEAVRELADRFDPREGGFTPAPKFPPSGALLLLLRHLRRTGDETARSMIALTLDKMAAGGLYDQLGGGFHRYATDDRWLVPHFEKMLYDNALLARVYLEAFQALGREDWARVARETLDFVIREMQGEEGGYSSSQDADSEGVEGKYYVWSAEEIRRHLDEATAEAFARVYGVREEGNWEGVNILHRARSVEAVADELGVSADELARRLETARRRLLDVRRRRVPPGLDDKVLLSWNGLMIAAMARGYRVLGDERYLDSARRAARFVTSRLVRDDGRWLATYRDGRAQHLACLDDLAFLMAALVELYETDFDLDWLEAARRIAEELDRLFWDERAGGYFFTGTDHERLLVRTKTGYDGAIPSGNAVAAASLVRLALLTDEDRYRRRAEATLRAFSAQMGRSPSAFAHLLLVVDALGAETVEVVVVGSAASTAVREALRALWRPYAPNDLVLRLDPEAADADRAQERVPLLRGKGAGKMASGPVYYVCRRGVCAAPTQSLDEAVAALGPPAARATMRP